MVRWRGRGQAAVSPPQKRLHSSTRSLMAWGFTRYTSPTLQSRPIQISITVLHRLYRALPRQLPEQDWPRDFKTSIRSPIWLRPAKARTPANLPLVSTGKPTMRCSSRRLLRFASALMIHVQLHLLRPGLIRAHPTLRRVSIQFFSPITVTTTAIPRRDAHL